MAYTTEIYISNELDPYLNQVREEVLFHTLNETTIRLFLYRNQESIILGKNQIPWRECSTGIAKQRKIPLVRRISGGGTVYHDPGNINIALMGGDKLPPDIIARKLQKGLQVFGLDLEINKRGDLLFQGLKISGHAHLYRQKKALHHATLLVESNLNLLRKLMVGLSGDFQSHGVFSNRSPVTRLIDHHLSLTVDFIMSVLPSFFVDRAKVPPPIAIHPDLLDNTKQQKRYDDLQADCWIYGKTPTFSYTPPFPNAGLIIVEKGLIKEIHTPLQDKKDEQLTDLLRGCPFDKDAIINSIIHLQRQQPSRERMILWLSNCQF